MALIKCPNCQKDVSSMVTYCPFCNTDLTQAKASAARSGDYYNPDAVFSYRNPDDWPASENRKDNQEQGLKFEDFPSDRYEYRRGSDNLEYRREPEDFEHDGTSGSFETRNASGTSKNCSNHTNAASNTAAPRKKGRRLAPPGRRLLGYRAGQPLYMLISICYYMAACVGILYAFSLSSQYLANGTLLFHLCRVLLAAAALFLPALLLSENTIRRKLPLLGSRNKAVVSIGFLILYIPLTALFLVSWYYCL